MYFWTVLIVSFLILILLYLYFGHKKVWLTLIIYIVVSAVMMLVIYLWFRGLFNQDLFALVIPCLFLVPFDRMMHTIANYTDGDPKPATYFVAVINRILIVMWYALIVLGFGIGLAIINMVTEQINSYNLSSLIITSFIFLLLLSVILSFLKKSSFTYILIVGETIKTVYKLKSTKSRISVKKCLGEKIKVYPRGMYQDEGEMTYIYYTPAVQNLDKTLFEKYHSELFDAIKDSADNQEKFEESYNEYLERKSSIL